jgi:hypothetical protein
MPNFSYCFGPNFSELNIPPFYGHKIIYKADEFSTSLHYAVKRVWK